MANGVDIVKKLQQVQQISSTLHWFCPRSGSEDNGYYFPEDVKFQRGSDGENASATPDLRVSEARSRKSLVLDALQIFAFDGPDAAPHQSWLKQNLARQLQNCEICVREFHRGRADLKEKLEDAYDEEDVRAFLSKFDGINAARIRESLDHAKDQVEAVAPEKRSVSKLDNISLYAIFEALNCVPVYEDEEFLDHHFDQPFFMLQTKKSLKMTSIPPALAHFLFGEDRQRRQWANKTLSDFARTLSSAEFEHNIRDTFHKAMLRVQLTNIELDFVPQFWAGARAIVQKLDQNLITHSLRAMDIDICKLALDNLQIDKDSFKDLLATVKHILAISPRDFWEAMGSIPPSTWVDEFFKSQAFERLLKTAAKSESSSTDAFDELFSWMIPFLKSINPINQPTTCRKITNQLLGAFQTEAHFANTRSYCFRLAVQLIGTTLTNMNSRAFDHTNATLSEIFEAVSYHIGPIAKNARTSSELATECSEVLQLAIALDCKVLISDMHSMNNERATGIVNFGIHDDIWNKSVFAIDQNSRVLCRSMLLAFRGLVGVERHVVKLTATLSESSQRFNTTLDSAYAKVQDFLETMNEFDQSIIRDILDTSDTTAAAVMLLFSSNNLVQAAAVEFLKSATGQTTRREAIGSFIKEHQYKAIDGLSLSCRQLSVRKSFAPCPTLLKLSADVLDALCNAEDGILRQPGLSQDTAKAVERFWQALWNVLAMIFRNTEPWSNAGHDKKMLMDFCKDTMEFAEKTFDEFGIFAGALGQDAVANTPTKDSVGQRLTEQPKSAMKSIVHWLKLRDDFLVSKSLALVCKLLDRLTQFEAQLSEETLHFLARVLSGEVRTMLTQQQKASLQRAYEAHFGEFLADDDDVQIVSVRPKERQRTIDLVKWQATSKHGISDPKPSVSTAKSSTEVQKGYPASKPPVKPPAKPFQTKPTVDPASFRLKREQERLEKKKRDALAVAQARERAGLTGNAGSALSGLGVQGIDHSAKPKGSGMMVSSDESSDGEDEEDVDRVLFGSNVSKRSTKGKAIPEEPIRKQKPQGPVKKQRIVRSARDMRARLAPDLTQLHKSLLSWDYFAEGDFPPNSDRNDYSAVLESFRDPMSYKETFQPLLLLEAWNGFLKAREESSAKPYSFKVLNRSSVDSFLEVSTTMPQAERDTVNEGDLVLLSRAKTPTSTPNEPHCLVRAMRITRKKAQLEVLYRAIPGTSLVPYLAPDSQLFGQKVTSLIPLEREYGALCGLEYYDLCMEIAVAKPSPLLSYADETLQPFMRNYGVNKAQAKAIKSALDNDAFTLVQGPPGSGKTKTIVAIVGALLTQSLQSSGTAISRPTTNGAHVTSQAPNLAKKLLVCAPSNAAVDELVMRFKEGVKATSGEHRPVRVVRLGRSDAINANVQDVTLEELVNKKLDITSNSKDSRQNTQQVMDQHKEVSEKLRDARLLLDAEPSKDHREAVETLKRKKAALGLQVDAARDKENSENRQADINRKRAQQAVIDEAHVICATLSGSGHEMFQNLNVEFETVVIDEAAQCVELSALIPLKYGCAKCVLVGDPQQLPPTVFSREAARFKYEQSLFVRMQSNFPEHVHLLDTQYRMHPEISAFPSRSFYDSRLLDGKDMAKLRARPWHASSLLGPFRFFDVQGQHQAAQTGHSLINEAEVKIAMALYRRLTTDYRDYDFSGKVGVITPYKSQLRLLRDRFQGQFGQAIVDKVEFNTTDAFQGRESEVIIFSCVRASPAGGIGFLQDIRRMNVGLTRAKSSLWVLGNSQSLMRGEYWSKLVQDAQHRGKFTSGDLETILKQRSKGTGRAEIEPAAMSSDVTMTDAKDARYWNDKPTANMLPPETGNGLPVRNEKHSSSNRASPVPPSVPAKRKASSDLIAKPKHSSSPSSDNDVEMTDAPVLKKEAPAAADTPATSRNGSTSSNTSAIRVKMEQPEKPRESTTNSASTTTVAKKPMVKPKAPPAFLTKKAPADPFIRKKPKP